jgi:hypothetical protein
MDGQNKKQLAKCLSSRAFFLLLLGHTHSLALVASGLGVLTAHTQAPEIIFVLGINLLYIARNTGQNFISFHETIPLTTCEIRKLLLGMHPILILPISGPSKSRIPDIRPDFKLKIHFKLKIQTSSKI